jgi:hypothetical protein
MFSMPPPGHRGRVCVRALIIPTDLTRPCQVTELALTAAALSDAIGGGLLDDILIDTFDGARHYVYADAERFTHRHPVNHRAVLLATCLGWLNLIDCFRLLGDILILGADSTGNDTDIHHPVIETAHRTGLLPLPPLSTPRDAACRALTRRHRCRPSGDLGPA